MILLFLLGYLLQGMSEEVLVRGYFMVSLGRANSIGWAVIMSSLMFAMLHIFNAGLSVLAFINLALYGLMMALYMLKHESIWGVCAIHSAWNFVQGNVFGVQVSGMPLTESVFATELTGSHWITGGDFGLEGGLAVTVVLLAGIALVWLTKRKTA
jgi:membrane protease YdiL (CAAX protease family)